MKLTISLSLLFLLFCTSKFTAQDHHENNGFTPSSISHLSVINNQLVDDDGNPVILRGISYGWHNWWPRFYNSSTVKTFKNDWKVNLVRAAMGVEPDGGYIDNPAWSLSKIKSVIEAAIEEDIYVIIDWHSHNIKQEEAIAFFTEMAKSYGDRPNIIYEIFNEPEDQSWDEVKSYSIAVINAIRAHDPDNIILVGSPHWCQDIHLVADDPIVGYGNLMYTLHFYAGTHKQWLRDRADYALGKGIPIFVSECASMEATGDGPIDHESWNEWLTWMAKHQLSWATWSVSDKDETCSMFLPSSSDTGPWKAHEIKPWGQIVKNSITQHSK
ncbi:glycoside hydrolase family 5 protein [Anditalea andensis]|uniref:Glycosyl hydrolase family 5 n=1 Tax=Anditalea andensis TaxID=1048983 RepID=A0A074KVL9_9BACT|nr:glycoside hydrolase family 5 protein [Anditalea andensis]KEO72994.1 glycosyl hydrolase family 5 [Anditalea andensis]